MKIYCMEDFSLVFFSWVDNPEFDLETEKQKIFNWMEERKKIMSEKRLSRPSITPPDQIPPSFCSQNPIVLSYPYTAEDVMTAYQQTMRNINRFPPYSRNKRDWKKDPIMFYTGKNKFREATYGKRLILADWDQEKANSRVSLNLPCKTSGMWWGIETAHYSDENTMHDFAATIVRFAQMDLTNHSSVRVYKSILNL